MHPPYIRFQEQSNAFLKTSTHVWTRRIPDCNIELLCRSNNRCVAS